MPSATDEWLASRRDRRQSDRFIRQSGDVPFGEAGAPVGPPWGSVIDFGRYSGWTLSQIRRRDPEFLEWLMRVRRSAVARRDQRHVGRPLTSWNGPG